MAEQERENKSKVFDNLSGTQKSAILMMLLGEDEASEILKNLTNNKKNYFSLSKKQSLNEAASNLYKILRLIKNKGYKKIQISKNL